MPRTPSATALTALLLASLAAAGCNRDAPAPAPQPAAPAAAPAPAPPPAPEPPPAPAVTVTGVDLGNAIGDDDRVATPMTAFAPTDTLYASVATTAPEGATPIPGKLTARWTYQDGQLVDELPQDYAFSGDGHTAFQVSHPDGWPAGRYKLEILLDDALVQTREFTVAE